MSKEEDVTLADLLSNLNVSTINGTEQETTVQAELHVGGTRSLSARSRDVLRDIRSRDQHLGERDGVVGQEVDLEVVLGVGVGVDDTGDIDDQADGLSIARLGWLHDKTKGLHTNLAM